MSAALGAPGIALAAEALIALRHEGAGRRLPAPASALPGGFATRKRGHGQEMADVREYVEGDDVRHLDRGSTARTGTLHVRTFHEERDRATLLVADFRPSMLWGTRRALRSVAAAEALALIGWCAVAEGGRVGLLALAAEGPVAVPIRGRARGMLAVIGGMVRAHGAALEAAAAGQVAEEPTLAEGLTRAARLAPVGAEVVVASGFDAPGADLDERLGQLAQRRVPRLLHVRDGATDLLPPGTYPIRLPDGRRRRVRVAGESPPPSGTRIAGHPVLPLDAGAPLARTAALLATAFPEDRAP